MIKDHSDSEKGNPLLPHRGSSFRLTARVILYAPSHRQDSTYHGLCYTSRGALAGTTELKIPEYPTTCLHTRIPKHETRTALHWNGVLTSANKTVFCVGYPGTLALEVVKRQSAQDIAMSRMAYPNIVPASVVFVPGDMI